jgi:hypothetical protein
MFACEPREFSLARDCHAARCFFASLFSFTSRLGLAVIALVAGGETRPALMYLFS